MYRVITAVSIVLLAASIGILAAEDEGTRHIVGPDADMFFMNDKVFGTVSGHPLWAIYNCGSDIKGEIDVAGSYQPFNFEYKEGGEFNVVGTFGDKEISLGEIEKKEGGFVYHVFVGKQEHQFSIRYEQIEDGHLVNSIIEGTVGEGRNVKLTVDGHLCPFATTGIVLIAAGSTLAG